MAHGSVVSLLLDTCVLLWLADDPRQLPERVRAQLGPNGPPVHVSAITALELGIKVARGKLQLPLPVSEWFPALCHRNQLHILPVDAAVAAASTELPDLHRDPFDRILVATAMQRSMTLVTPDGVIPRYRGLVTLW